MTFYPKPKSPPAPRGVTEFELLKASHRFLREGDTDGAAAAESSRTWEDKLAAKYYDSLYREFAVCDLKHYKSGNFSLRWRTENEVVDGAGESSCGNTRCPYHSPTKAEQNRKALTTIELPFVYEEHGETKTALVKVVLCDKCMKKLMYKRRKEKEAAMAQAGGGEEAGIAEVIPPGETAASDQEEENARKQSRRSRSRSPSRRENLPRRRHSPR